MKCTTSKVFQLKENSESHLINAPLRPWISQTIDWHFHLGDIHVFIEKHIFFLGGGVADTFVCPIRFKMSFLLHFQLERFRGELGAMQSQPRYFTCHNDLNYFLYTWRILTQTKPWTISTNSVPKLLTVLPLFFLWVAEGCLHPDQDRENGDETLGLTEHRPGTMVDE